MNTREKRKRKRKKSGHRSFSLHFFFVCCLKWGCHNVMQRYEKCEVDDPFFDYWNFFFLFSLVSPHSKFQLNLGSSLNPDDGGQKDDVNFVCKMCKLLEKLLEKQ